MPPFWNFPAEPLCCAFLCSAHNLPLTFAALSSHFVADALVKLVPTLVAALALWLCMTRARSPWALPITLAIVPATFHIYLLATGTTLTQAQDAGWVLKPEVGVGETSCALGPGPSWARTQARGKPCNSLLGLFFA